MRKRRSIEIFSISFLDLLSGALGAVIILYVAIPKTKAPLIDETKPEVAKISESDLQKKDEEILELKAQLAEAVEKKAVSKSSRSGITPADLDVGFKFKGKRVVFLIDTSYSMVDEDRMGQVKAGIKMLLTAMPDDFNVEIVRYPWGERAPFKSMWGDLRNLSADHKTEAFKFIYSLNPFGGTPTRDALLFVLQNYDSVSDIVLLTDGVPTLHNSNKKDDIYDILQVVREHNPEQKIRINAIGVGSDFIQDKTNDRFKFLSLLTQENDGFFVGF